MGSALSFDMETLKLATARSCWMKQTMLRSYQSDSCMGLCRGTALMPGLRKICLNASGLTLFCLRNCKNHPNSFLFFKYISEPIWCGHEWAALCRTMFESVSFINSFSTILCTPSLGLMVPVCHSSTRTTFIFVICEQEIQDCSKLTESFVGGKATKMRVSVRQSDGTFQVFLQVILLWKSAYLKPKKSHGKSNSSTSTRKLFMWSECPPSELVFLRVAIFWRFVFNNTWYMYQSRSWKRIENIALITKCARTEPFHHRLAWTCIESLVVMHISITINLLRLQEFCNSGAH